MGETVTTVLVIFLGAILLFVFPLSSISEMQDKEVLSMVQAYTTDFVNEVITTREITQDMYNGFVQKLYATGNSYEIEIEVRISDANPVKKTESTDAGDTQFFSEFTNQVMTQLREKGRYALKQGDYIIVRVRNTNTTLSQMIKATIYGVVGDNAYVIVAMDAGMVV